MYETATSKVLRLRTDAARKARVALATALVAVSLVAPPLAAGLVAPPAHASTTFLVTNTNDSGAGSLRQAILDANNTAGADTINFAIPEALRDPNTGVATIKPQSALPNITEQVTINGYSQPGASPNTKTVGDDASLKVQLDGTNAGFTSGLLIGAQNSVIRGLVINRFAAAGINTVEGGDGSKVEGNFIGTDPSGTKALGNRGSGVALGTTSNNVVGGTTPDKRNILSGNQGNGIVMFGFGVGGDNEVRGNLIGTDKSGIANLGNGNNGVLLLASSDNTIGGDSAAASNTIAFNGSIGTPNGSDGVAIFGDGTNTGNRILRNSVFSNEGLGVDLIGPNEDGSTNVSNPNDASDVDPGTNNLQNTPVINTAKTSSTGTTVAGTLNSTPNKTFVVRFYSNPAGGDEGKKFLGKLSVLTGGKGNATFTKALPKAAVGKTVTATATDAAGNTSEFSTPRTVTSA